MAESKMSIRFWGTFIALCILSFISGLNVAIIMTALPTITAEIGGAKKYPLFGQLANVFGRRLPFIGATVLFALGSVIAGGASNVGMLIAGRTIQGVGAGGIYVLLDIVCCDLVPLRERGKYLGLMFSWSGLAAGMGPVLRGALAEANWRWIFYMNIPTCASALLAILLLMRLQEHTELQEIDILGNLIFIPRVLAVLLGLVMGGIEHPWSSWRVVLPLVLGVAGWIAVRERLFSNRTSATGFVLTFLSSIMVQASGYFLPVFFQAVLGTTVVRSGVNFLPLALGMLVFAVVAGVLMKKIGKYKLLHAASFAISAIGFGLLTLLDESTAKWAVFQLITDAGLGFSLSTLLPAIMAPLSETDVASSIVTYSFIRSFGYVWGVTIASTVFNGVFDYNLPPTVFANQARFVRGSIGPTVWAEVVEVYQRSLRTIWWLGMGINIVCFCLVWVEKSIPLRQELDTQYSIDGEKKSRSAEQEHKAAARKT
ncbi:MFS general substrate transporter [Clathrospora elynae]|uniref:MFS general substrate transporter n=1 Tax=Clathrospora elynae TaxID=706981 RepID=A0A6A5SVX5_9PLEO|nr:MFS general substrate transporter [Clathrospora elynae]